MPPPTAISSVLRRTLLVKVIAKTSPSREDIASIIELTSSRVVDAIQAQSMTFFLVEGGNIHFKHVYYSPSLWGGDDRKEAEFTAKVQKLKSVKIPLGQGLVGATIESGKPDFYSAKKEPSRPMYSMSKDTGFEVTSMLTVPLMANGKAIGAIQVLNKEPSAMIKDFTQEDLKIVQEVAEYAAPLIQRMQDPKFEIHDSDMAAFISRFTGLPLVTKEEDIQIDQPLLEAVGEQTIRREGIIPHKRLSPSTVAVLMTNPLDFNRKEAFSHATDLSIEEVSVIPATLFEKILKKNLQSKGETPVSVNMGEITEVIGAEFGGAEAAKALENNENTDEDSAPIIQLATRIVEDAFICGTSDIHIEPMEKELIVRYRVDGICQEKLRLPRAVANPLIARYKVMANLDISEKRLPQDGRIVFKQFTKKKMDIDLRVATAPQNFGEKVVMRILDKSKSTLPITALGFSEYNLGRYRELIRQPYGMILHCGPTGSGKSMTLFSALQEINSPEINIQTAEDPIEYTLHGVNQMQMKKEIGLTFARSLRAFLRMDPDVILVGEIRDQETAEIAVEAALTGHLLLSTLHTNDAPSTVARFADMGVERFMISSSLLVVCAQRLIRRACKNCKMPYMPEGNEKEIIARALDGWTGEIFKASDGCPSCGGNGYKGRVGIHELMTNNEELTKAINEGAETDVIKRIAMRTGMKTLHQDTMLKVREGVTTVLEALANVPPDMTASDAKH